MGIEELQRIHAELTNIKTNLRKLGLERREVYKSSVEEKLLKAKTLFQEYNNVLISLQLGKSSSELDVCDALSRQIEGNYTKILSYKPVEENENIVEQSVELPLEKDENITVKTMDKFDIKTAATLISVMDDKEETTEKIIDSIEMYSSCLGDETSKKLLIAFVLKTRLSKIAKHKVKSDYKTVEELIVDIKKYLLTKKSAYSLLTQLDNVSQKEKSIYQYGKQIEELFVDLTISQADNNKNAYEILRPINEELAIKKFADGLRNRRLSTIIAARDYSELKVMQCSEGS